MHARRIVISTFGSFGDIYPFIALALRLRDVGLDPLIATAEEYRERIEGEGIAFHPVRPSLTQVTARYGGEAETARQFALAGANFLVDEMIVPYLAESEADLGAVIAGAAMVVASSFAIPARIAAERRGVPVVTVILSPMLHFSAEEPFHAQELPWLPAYQRMFGAPGTRLVLTIGRAMMLRRHRPISRFRQSIGLPPLACDAVVDGPMEAELVACLYSPLLGTLPPDAVPQAFIGGYSLYDGAETIAPDLAEFLDAGPPPVVFSLGSYATFLGHDFYAASAAAARRIGRRAVLLVAPGEEGLIAARLAPGADIFIAGYVPHALVFPRAAAIVHHGGIGTVGQALRAGRPQLVAPLMGDQFDNAERLVRLGVARRLDHRRYTATRAATALRALLGDPSYAARAAEAGGQVSLEDGAAILAARIAARIDAGAVGEIPARLGKRRRRG